MSLRDVELILAARGIVVSYESIREWGLRFGRLFADALKRRRPRPGDKWYMEGPDGTTPRRFSATGIIFRFTPGTWRFDWHTATRRQYVVNLDGPNQITPSDGETRIIGTGEVILIEDLHGKGHLSQAAEGKFRHSILIPVD
ncbi:hypothetical protein ACFQX4_26630 [Roseomonas sp. GCM10028921]